MTSAVIPRKGVASSVFGAISNAYCMECLEAGREPWFCLVGGLSGIRNMDQLRDEVKPIIKATLEFYNKTEEQLWEEIRKIDEEYIAYYHSKILRS